MKQVFLSGKVLFGESELGFDDDDNDDGFDNEVDDDDDDGFDDEDDGNDNDDGFDDVSDSLQKFEPNFPSATEQNRFVTKHTKRENKVQNKCRGVGIAQR